MSSHDSELHKTADRNQNSLGACLLPVHNMKIPTDWLEYPTEFRKNFTDKMKPKLAMFGLLEFKTL